MTQSLAAHAVHADRCTYDEICDSCGGDWNSVEHAARDVLNTGRAEVAWLLMRNLHFSEGRQHDGRNNLMVMFALLDVNTRFVDRSMPNGTQMEWVLPTPIAPV